MRKVLSQIWRGTKRPVEAFNYFVRVMKRHNMLTEASRVRHRGERVVVTDFEAAGVKKNDPVVLQNLNRYQWVLSKVKGLDSLDAGCGSGYGTHYLATQGASKITGVDISAVAIDWCNSHFQADNLRYRQMDVRHLEFGDGAFEAVISFDVIEHLEPADQLRYVSEVARVLGNGGRAIIGCPNARANDDDNNPFHLHELTREEFDALLRRHFPDVALYTQKRMVTDTRMGRLPVWLSMPRNTFEITEGYEESGVGLLAVCRK